MTYSACDLQVNLDQLLREAGFWITGDDDETGWGYAFGVSEDGRELARGLDTAAEASEAAVRDLLDRVTALVGAARRVSDCWARGDLAEAVRELEVARIQLEPQAASGTNEADRRNWLRDRLRDLVSQGLTIGDCMQLLGVRTDADPLASKAVRLLQDDGAVEFDECTVVSESERGAYVLGWLWVDADDAKDDGN